MPLLSIIIVNYNVKYFVEQCLYAVQRAIAGMDAEVWVVDNNSSDGSVAWLREKFPWVNFIANTENAGYARANNQALAQAKGEYILFLNPDTLPGETALKDSIALLGESAETGALGIRMIDGTGSFLPESKRGFPTPFASLYKLSGWSALFPRSKRFNGYYMGWLPERENNDVEVLSGAFMLVKKQVIDKVGGFDERFFMYGEDIDLSYRIHLAGYRNIYFGETAIIHFKGESTARDARYTRLFYQAMVLFAQKHYRHKSRLYYAVIKAGIAIAGTAASVKRVLSRSASREAQQQPGRIIAIGEARDTAEAAAVLAANGRTEIIAMTAADFTGPAASRETAATLVLCAGGMAYTRIITLLEEWGRTIPCKFFAPGAGAFIGSASKESRGEVWEIKNETGKG